MTPTLSNERLNLLPHYNHLAGTISHNFPHLWGPVKLALGFWATGLLQGKPTHLRLNLIGDPSLGSQTVLETLPDIHGEHLSLGMIPHLDHPTWKTWVGQWGPNVHFLYVDDRCGSTLEQRWNTGKTPPPYELRLERCRRAVNQFLSTLEEVYRGEVVWDHHHNDPKTLEWIHRFARLQATLREESSEPIQKGLSTLAQGLKLLGGGEIMPPLLNVTISSMPPPFEGIFFNLINYEPGYITLHEVQNLLEKDPSSNGDQIMNKLDQLGIMKNEQGALKLREEWTWLHDYKVYHWYCLGYAGDLSGPNCPTWGYET